MGEQGVMLMGRRWRWTPVKEQAVAELASGWRSQREVAEALGVTRRVIEGWMRRPVFRQRVEQGRAAYQERLRAERAARLAAWRAEERARECAEEAAFERRMAAAVALPSGERARALRLLWRDRQRAP